MSVPVIPACLSTSSMVFFSPHLIFIQNNWSVIISAVYCHPHCTFISRTEILTRIENVILEIVNSVSRDEAPVLVLPNRSSWANVRYLFSTMSTAVISGTACVLSLQSVWPFKDKLPETVFWKSINKHLPTLLFFLWEVGPHRLLFNILKEEKHTSPLSGFIYRVV